MSKKIIRVDPKRESKPSPKPKTGPISVPLREHQKAKPVPSDDKPIRPKR